MLKVLKSFLPTKMMGKAVDEIDISTIAPSRLLLVIGDVHGCLNQMVRAVQRVEDHFASSTEYTETQPKLVFVGDYIDRGEQSAAVLDWLFQLQRSLPYDVVCLMGNHERMMLDFIDDPAGRGGRWLRNGGLQTLASFNVGQVRENSDVEELTQASLALEAAMPEGMLAWLRGLPMVHKTGNVCVVHAAMDPHLPPEDQSRQTFLWGHNEFMTTARTDGLWVVHGHTIVSDPVIGPSRISIDTGAYHSGRLTVALIEQGSCEFI